MECFNFKKMVVSNRNHFADKFIPCLTQAFIDLPSEQKEKKMLLFHCLAPEVEIWMGFTFYLNLPFSNVSRKIVVLIQATKFS